MARRTRSWEYVFGGVVFAWAGVAAMVGSIMSYRAGVPLPSLALIAVEVCFGAVLFGIGVYWLGKANQVYREESGVLRSRIPAK